MLKGADGPASASPAIKSTELIQSRRCCPRFAISLFPSYRILPSAYRGARVISTDTLRISLVLEVSSREQERE